jgi:hypothetical protein
MNQTFTKNSTRLPWTLLARLRARRSESGATDERGSILILALIFIVVVGGTVMSLAGWVTNDLNNSTTFTNARAAHYSASSVTNVAVNSIRYATLLTNGQAQNVATPLGVCWTPAGNFAFSQLTTDAVTVAAWCTTTENLVNANTRVVNVYSCVSTLTAASSPSVIAAAASQCQATPYLHVQVTFDDYPPGGAPPMITQCSTWCGQGVTLNKWAWT